MDVDMKLNIGFAKLFLVVDGSYVLGRFCG